MARFAVLLSLSLVVAPVAWAGPAKPKPRSLGTLPGPVLSDSARMVAWSDSERVRVKDTRTGESFVVTIPQGCRFAVIGGGQLLFGCPYRIGDDENCPYRMVPLLYSIRQRRFHWPTNFESVADWQRPLTGLCARLEFTGVGRRWLGYVADEASSDPQELFLEWHTGETAGAPSKPKHVLDLDADDLSTRLCPPLRRAPNPDYDERESSDDPYYDQLYVHPFSIQVGGWDEVFLKTCGSSRSRTLGFGHSAYGLTPRAAYAAKAWAVTIIITRSGRRLTYEFDEPGVTAVATRYRLYATVKGVGSDPPPAPKTYMIRLPRR